MAVSLVRGMGLFLAGVGIENARTSQAARAFSRRQRAIKSACKGCERRRAEFREHGIVTWGRYHARCGRCYRALAGQRN